MKANTIYIFFAILFIASCGSKSSNDFAAQSEPEFAKSETFAGTANSANGYFSGENISQDTISTQGSSGVKRKKIIKTANISFGVSDYKKSKSAIEGIIKNNKGFIASESENNSSYQIYNTIIIRVPAENFESLLKSLEGEADDFESKSISTNDVTEEFVDIKSRLENKKKTEAQYLEILKKAKTIAEILEVNEHIRRLREEIEAKEGRLKYLSSQVGLSTVTLYIHQDYNTVSFGFFHKIGNAFEGGWEGFLAFIIGILYLWPLVIVASVVYFLIRKSIRKRKLKK